MGRELQKRKRRAGKQPVRRPAKSTKNRVLSNSIISANWNRKETLAQNYKRLGLVSKLNKRAGGVERLGTNANEPRKEEPSAVQPGTSRSSVIRGKNLQEVKLVRDEEGNLVVDGGEEARRRRRNPLNDPLNELDDDESDFSGFEDEDDEESRLNRHWQPSLGYVGGEKEGVARTLVTEALEAEARNGVAAKARHQSTREEEWLEQLVQKHGDDYEGMFRDRKLNIMQQSQGDLRRRVKKYLAKNSSS